MSDESVNPRFQFTTRQLLIVVFVVALACVLAPILFRATRNKLWHYEDFDGANGYTIHFLEPQLMVSFSGVSNGGGRGAGTIMVGGLTQSESGREYAGGEFFKAVDYKLGVLEITVKDRLVTIWDDGRKLTCGDETIEIPHGEPLHVSIDASGKMVRLPAEGSQSVK